MLLPFTETVPRFLTTLAVIIISTSPDLLTAGGVLSSFDLHNCPIRQLISANVIINEETKA